VIAKKKKKNFNLLLSSKRILYRKLEIRTDTRDYLIRIPAISVTKQNPNKFSLVPVAETVRLLEAYVSVFVIPAKGPVEKVEIASSLHSSQ